MNCIKKIFKSLLICIVVSLLMPVGFVYATSSGRRELTDRENAAFIVRDEWTAWVRAFTASLSELDKNATSRIYRNMDYYDMQYRFTEKYKKVPEYLDEDGKPTQKLKEMIKEKRKEISGATITKEYLEFLSNQNGSTIYYSIMGSISVDIGYSRDGSTFSKWNPNETVTLNAGESIYVLNRNDTLSSDASNHLRFVMSGSIEATGNIMSLLNFKDEVPPYAFYYLFANNSALTKAPDLPATKISNSSYEQMFQNCSNLTVAPDLPAIDVKDHSYFQMFYGCTNLVRGPHIKAKTVYDSLSLSRMFYSCSNLNYIKLDYTGAIDFADWVNGVADSGEIFYEGPTNTFGSSALPKDDTHRWIVTQSPTELRFTANEASTIKYIKNGNVSSDIYYSYDRQTWTPWTENTDISLSTNDKIYVKNNNSVLSNSRNNYLQFVMTGSLSGGGDISSIINYGSIRNYCFYKLFKDCVSLRSAPSLPATTLAEGCYEEMFAGCNNLTVAPDILATRVALESCKNMFNGCANLASAPSRLPATYLYANCYEGMFSGCENITVAPTLPATTLSQECYKNMFNGCINLTTAPALPATTLRYRSYESMFQNCESLTVAPTLPATTVAEYCYYKMFQGCTNLTTAPAALQASTLYTSCYGYMFDGCENLATVPTLPATTLANYCYEYMFRNCKNIPVAPDLPATTMASGCYMFMFYGCENITVAPELPATTLASQCYASLFRKCIGLTQAPDLPATTLATACYESMFYDCTNLNYINISYTGDFGISYFSDWVKNVSDTGTFVYTGTYNTYFSSSYIPKDSTHPWTVVATLYSGLTFKSTEDGSTVAYTARSAFDKSGMQKSVNAVDWESWDGSAITLDNNEKLYVKNTRDSFSTNNYNAYAQFNLTGKIEASGDISSLKNFTTTLNSVEFYCLFANNGDALTNVENLILPFTNLANGVYCAMFSSCTAITKAPELPATTLCEGCYTQMFYGCTSLNYIKIGYTGSFQGFTGESPFNFWVGGPDSSHRLPTTGNFYYNGSDTTYKPTSGQGIPYNWTVHTY